MKGQLLLYASLAGLAASLRPGSEPPRTGSRRAFTAALLAWPLAAERATAATLQQQLLSKAGVDESKIATAQTTARSSGSAADAPRLVKPEKAEFLKGTANNEELRKQRLAAYDEALAGYEAAKKQVEVNGGRGLFANPFAEAEEEVVSPEELARREQSFQQRKAATLAACRKSPPEPPDFEYRRLRGAGQGGEVRVPARPVAVRGVRGDPPPEVLLSARRVPPRAEGGRRDVREVQMSVIIDLRTGPAAFFAAPASAERSNRGVATCRDLRPERRLAI